MAAASSTPASSSASQAAPAPPPAAAVAENGWSQWIRKPALVLYPRERLERSPSRASGVTAAKESDLRVFFCSFIHHAGQLLEMPVVCIATATTFFHRFYALQSFAHHNPQLIARTCLLLASKVEECACRIRDIINVCHRVQHPRAPPMRVSPEFWQLKNEMVTQEQILLRVLAYELTCRHAHHYVLHVVHEVDGTEDLAEASWAVANDSTRTSLCLQHPPLVIACGCVYLAAEIINFPFARHTEWWERVGAKRNDVEDVCLQMTEFYARFGGKSDADKFDSGVRIQPFLDAYERDLKSRVRRADKEKGEEKEGAGPSTQPTPPLPALVAQAVAEAALPDTPRVTWPCSIERSEKELAAAASELQAQSVEILRSLAKVQFRPMPMPPQQ